GATKVYDGTTTFTGVDLTLNTGDVVSGDTVTATADGTSASKDVGASHAFTATSVTLGGTHKDYYSLAVGTVTGNVAITAKPLTDAMISGIAANYDYTGKAINPTPTVTDGTPSIIATSDYTVSYGANKKASTGGTVTITATSGGNYSGTVSKSFTIGKANSTAGLTVDKSDKTYTYGDTITFTVNVGLPKAKLFARAAAINTVDFYLGTDTTGTKLNSSAITLTETGGTGTATFAYDTTKNTAIPFNDNITVTAVYGGSGNLNSQTASVSGIKLQEKAISGTVTIDIANGTGSDKKTDKGDTLTANVTAIQPTEAQSELTYQWYRGTDKITEATNQTYVVTDDDKAKTLSVEVTAGKNYSGTVTSTGIEVDKEPIEGSISITGTTVLGDTLTLDTSSLTPSGATFTTKWQRDGVDITGATAETYQLTKDDLGNTITVLITATDTFTGSMTATKDIPSIKPEKPVITATAGNEQVVLTWTAPFDGGSAITGYELTVTPGITGSPFTIAGSEASYTVTGLTNGTGYEFTLKATNAKGDSEISDTVSATPNVAYTVTFQSNGGSTVAEQQVTAGNKVTKPADPTKPDHRFDGWYKDSAFTTVWDFDTDTVQADTTIYAKWTPVGSNGDNGDTLDNSTGNGNNSTAGEAAKVTAASNAKRAVNTGDTTPFVWLIALLVLSGAGIIAVSVWKRRKR
ncbi:MAG: InlB B-repeat-containing protein, partial [Hespellia sp.]|nr:InlB B-repeat-containing protein [Hespellia sp.]